VPRIAIAKTKITSVIRKFRKMTSWLRALRERRGGSGTRSGRSASLADFGMIGPFWPSRPFGKSLFSVVSSTSNPFFLSLPAL
jgi:hypothetical protein